MTQEEKARAYDEALEEAKKWHKAFVMGQNYPASDIKVSYEWIFPELKESEDERIRRFLISGMTALKKQRKETFATIPINDCIAWLEKQGEQKPFDYENANIQQKDFAPKQEPKFKVGDWVVDKNGTVHQILSYKNDIYKHTNGYSATIFEDGWRIWDITKDAKDGDVLALERDKTPFIFKEFDKFYPEFPVAYCGIDDNGIFISNSSDGWWTNEKVKPATKEQRDLLFQKMKEVGYTFDFEKKKLKKIEQKPQRIVSAEAKEALYGKPIWSEEDERMYRKLHNLIYSTQYCDSRKELSDWLESLKDRKENKL